MLWVWSYPVVFLQCSKNNLTGLGGTGLTGWFRRYGAALWHTQPCLLNLPPVPAGLSALQYSISGSICISCARWWLLVCNERGCLSPLLIYQRSFPRMLYRMSKKMGLGKIDTQESKRAFLEILTEESDANIWTYSAPEREASLCQMVVPS